MFHLMTSDFRKVVEIYAKDNPKLLDKEWRLSKKSGLYWIKGKDGKPVLFEPNWAQIELLKDPHPLKIIPKSRQLGVTTFYAINYIDDCIFNETPIDTTFIADRRENAELIFENKVKFAWERMPDWVTKLNPASKDSTRMLRWANGSSYVVDTAPRGGTFQRLHISEFGKICAKYPAKAQEIIEGALETVAIGQQVTIESTSEGRGGYFYDICKQAQEKAVKGEEPGEMDYKLFFFPWWKESTYTLN